MREKIKWDREQKDRKSSRMEVQRDEDEEEEGRGATVERGSGKQGKKVRAKKAKKVV